MFLETVLSPASKSTLSLKKVTLRAHLYLLETLLVALTLLRHPSRPTSMHRMKHVSVSLFLCRFDISLSLLFATRSQEQFQFLESSLLLCLPNALPPFRMLALHASCLRCVSRQRRQDHLQRHRTRSPVCSYPSHPPHRKLDGCSPRPPFSTISTLLTMHHSALLLCMLHARIFSNLIEANYHRHRGATVLPALLIFNLAMKKLRPEPASPTSHPYSRTILVSSPRDPIPRNLRVTSPLFHMRISSASPMRTNPTSSETLSSKACQTCLA